jgi:hypothetical protein
VCGRPRKVLAHGLLSSGFVARRFAACALALALAAAASVWVLATEHRDAAPDGEYELREPLAWPVTPARASEIRNDALRNAQVFVARLPRPALDLDTLEPPVTCRFVARYPSGTSAKFDCVLEGGEIVKVKYGRNPEVAAEVAATRLLSALGYAADRMALARTVRCYGCPRYPFFAMRLLQLTGTYSLYPVHGDEEGYSEFTWAAVERKFGTPIETPDIEGWAWWELSRHDGTEGATRADIDALRLMAVFLAHWDNKSENQRLVCMDPPTATDARCERPLLMLQDLGATFGPAKANLAQWTTRPVWADRATCTVSMKALPFHGGTFPDSRISEEARVQVAEQLGALTDAEVTGLFAAARFPEHYSGTDDDRDVAAWLAAFKDRVDQIRSAGPCPQ